MTTGKPLCFCFNVTKADVLAHFSEGAGTYESLVEKTKIGTKCTACLLDLDLVLDELHQARNSAIISDHEETGSGYTIRQAVDFTDSGFFMMENGMSTRVRLSNFSQLYRPGAQIVPFRFDLILLSEAGRVIGRLVGDIDKESDVTIDFSDCLDAPANGWFLLNLFPLAEGYFGTLRPQVAIGGAGWCATYHTQPHMMASMGKYRHEVVLMGNGSRLATSISVINTSRRPTNLTVSLRNPSDGSRRSEKLELHSMASRILDLDALFPQAAAGEPLFVSVRSDQPTRKHIINTHTDGSWSVDHFPN